MKLICVYALIKVNWHLKMTNHRAGRTVGGAVPPLLTL